MAAYQTVLRKVKCHFPGLLGIFSCFLQVAEFFGPCLPNNIGFSPLVELVFVVGKIKKTKGLFDLSSAFLKLQTGDLSV